jgi:hypothetical protein
MFYLHRVVFIFVGGSYFKVVFYLHRVVFFKICGGYKIKKLVIEKNSGKKKN